MSSKDEQKYYYRKYKIAHACTKCGKQDAYTLRGRTLCFECNEKNKVISKRYAQEHHDLKSQKAKEKREELKAMGICPKCRKRPAENNKVCCSICAAKNRKASKKYQKKHGSLTHDTFYCNGLCWRCGKAPHMEGKKLCSDCYAKQVKNAAKGTEASQRTKKNHIWRGLNDATFLKD
jgi:NMD protein affecting ribosome stability and mRNA decay